VFDSLRHQVLLCSGLSAVPGGLRAESPCSAGFASARAPDPALVSQPERRMARFSLRPGAAEPFGPQSGPRGHSPRTRRTPQPTWQRVILADGYRGGPTERGQWPDYLCTRVRRCPLVHNGDHARERYRRCSMANHRRKPPDSRRAGASAQAPRRCTRFRSVVRPARLRASARGPLSRDLPASEGRVLRPANPRFGLSRHLRA
jgi:hypothetical protein